MISSQVIQKTLDELRMITRIDLCVMDIDGKVNTTKFATEEEDFGDVRAFAESMADSQVMKGCHFFKIYDNQTVEYILVAKGGNEDAYMIGRVAVAEIQNLIQITAVPVERVEKRSTWLFDSGGKQAVSVFHAPDSVVCYLQT